MKIYTVYNNVLLIYSYLKKFKTCQLKSQDFFIISDWHRWKEGHPLITERLVFVLRFKGSLANYETLA